MVDMKEFTRFILQLDEGGLILGGRFQPINDLFEYFFGEIHKKGAKLVFFCCLSEGKYSDINQHRKNYAIYDCIRKHQSLKDHLHNEQRLFGNVGKKEISAWSLRPFERIWYNLIPIAEKYGEVFMNYAFGLREIFSYARQNKGDVLALITRDTSYLIYDDEFEFWSLSKLQILALKIEKFDRQALKKVFGLNSLQMQLLSIIAHLEPEEKRRICGNDDLLRGCTPYVKRQKYGPDGRYDVTQWKNTFNDAQLKKMSSQLNHMGELNSSTAPSKHDINDLKRIKKWTKTDKSFESIMQFCKSNIYFAYKLMNESTTIPKDWSFIDLREPHSAQFIELLTNITLKLCGIIFKDVKKQPKDQLVATITNNTIVSERKEIVYPPGV